MANDGWIEFDGTEIVNMSRTAQLAAVMGLDPVWETAADTQWIQDALGGTDYDDITEAPWYDPEYPASGEFAGVVSLGFPGLDDSTLTATPIEYVTDGGSPGLSRNTTLAIVASVAIAASTDRGADYGKRWLDRVLKGNGGSTLCNGCQLRYFRWASDDAPIAHRRNVKITRGTSITRKRRGACSSVWLLTFTLTAGDSYEYGEPVESLTELGEPGTSGPGVQTSGSLDLVQQSCPVYDYTPVYDPLHPALVDPPEVPDFYPAGWGIEDDMEFTRFWARVDPVESSFLNVVPLITLVTDEDARRVRISIWPSGSTTSDQCDPLFSAVVSYLPAGTFFVIDGEGQVSYVTSDPGNPAAPVRRADSLVYSPDAKPVRWTAFNDHTNLLVTLDVFETEGAGTISATLELIPKSD